MVNQDDCHAFTHYTKCKKQLQICLSVASKGVIQFFLGSNPWNLFHYKCRHLQPVVYALTCLRKSLPEWRVLFGW